MSASFQSTSSFHSIANGNLPNERFLSRYRFLNTGVDYEDPIIIKYKKSMGAGLSKCYICHCMCVATKAVHIEVVTNLNTNYGESLSFVSRRGKLVKVFSDNGLSANMIIENCTILLIKIK